MSVLGRFHLAVKWRTWKRLPVLTYGGGPRIRPVVTNDENGKFAYRNGTVISPTSLVDDEYRDINLEPIVHEINKRAQIKFAIAMLFHLGIVKKKMPKGECNLKIIKNTLRKSVSG